MAPSATLASPEVHVLRTQTKPVSQSARRVQLSPALPVAVAAAGAARRRLVVGATENRCESPMTIEPNKVTHEAFLRFLSITRVSP